MSEQSGHDLLVGVIGPAGFGGSYLCVELLNRGHTVVGISRRPEVVGSHERYIPRPTDIEKLSVAELVPIFKDLDVLVSEYGPHTAGADALQYMPYLEVVRKLILAVKESHVKYFAFVGGAGSLHIPGRVQECLVDHPDFFLAYRRALTESETHVQYMEERLGPLGAALRSYREARLAQRKGEETTEQKAFIESYETNLRKKDQASNFIKAGRTAFMFFDGNTSFPWTFISPSPMYRPGKRTGKYEVTVDDVPLNGPQVTENLFEGRLRGISVSDMAIAIADEIETRRYKYKHWTAVGDLSDDSPHPSYITLDAVSK